MGLLKDIQTWLWERPSEETHVSAQDQVFLDALIQMRQEGSPRAYALKTLGLTEIELSRYKINNSAPWKTQILGLIGAASLSLQTFVIFCWTEVGMLPKGEIKRLSGLPAEHFTKNIRRIANGPMLSKRDIFDLVFQAYLLYQRRFSR